MCENVDEVEVLIQKAHEFNGLAHAGNIDPEAAWNLINNEQVKLVDIRTVEERKFVGYVPKSLNIQWATGTSFTKNPRFVREFEQKIKKDEVVFLICRSGKRSLLAAEALTKAGFKYVFNVLEGFEGDLNSSQHRNTMNGWKVRNLPWVQD